MRPPATQSQRGDAARGEQAQQSVVERKAAAMRHPVWRVEVARALDDEAHAALKAERATHVSGRSSPGMVSSTILVRATDEEAARAAITRALGEQAFIKSVVQTPVFVTAPVSDEARRAFEDAAGRYETVGGVVEDENEGSLEVYFKLPYDNVENLLVRTASLYTEIAEEAGLPVPEDLKAQMAFSGMDVLLFQATRDRELLDRAHELQRDGEHDLAVIVAQTACEVLIEDAVRSLTQSHVSDELWPWFLDRTRSFTLRDDPTRSLWLIVSGDDINKQPFWREYGEHVKRRNAIVHGGGTVDRQSAAKSLKAADALFDHVHGILKDLPPPG